MATASTRSPHSGTHAVGCRGAPSNQIPHPTNKSGHQQVVPSGELFPLAQQQEEDPSPSCLWALWGRGVPSWIGAFPVVSRQLGSISLGGGTQPVHTNSQQKRTPTRATFIPTNYLCRGAAIEQTLPPPQQRSSRETCAAPTPRCLLPLSLSLGSSSAPKFFVPPPGGCC